MAAGAVLPLRAPQAAGLSLDKLLHLCEYLLLAWCLRQACRASGVSRARILAIAFLLSTGYGLLLEGVQAWLPYREAEGMDLVANTVGAALGLWLGGRST